MGSLTVHVLDEDGNPIRGKKVFCDFPGTFLGVVGAHGERYTDEDGIAEFDDVPICTVGVYVGGELQVEVGVGSGEHEDATVTL